MRNRFVKHQSAKTGVDGYVPPNFHFHLMVFCFVRCMSLNSLVTKDPPCTVLFGYLRRPRRHPRLHSQGCFSPLFVPPRSGSSGVHTDCVEMVVHSPEPFEEEVAEWQRRTWIMHSSKSRVEWGLFTAGSRAGRSKGEVDQLVSSRRLLCCNHQIESLCGNIKPGNTATVRVNFSSVQFGAYHLGFAVRSRCASAPSIDRG